MTDKKIILAVTGSIAAYKSALFVRQLIKNGAEVQVLMTPEATKFITPLTLSTLSKRPVFTEIISEESWNNHVTLGLWADAMVIAPATANTLAKLSNGLCDNIVTATYLSAKCPVFIAPAMDLDMWKHPATIQNLERLRSFGDHLIPVGYGELASGLVGDGRMAEPEEIYRFLENYFEKRAELNGVHALVTAGPTYEPIDPVRFIGNHSSGKMGIAIAEELASRGAKVTLVIGPTKLQAAHPNIETVRVNTAGEMFQISSKHFPACQVAVLAAAVADYKPKTTQSNKIKKQNTELSIELERTPDIAEALGKMKNKNQLIVGFALETDNEEANAAEKLQKKNFDFIVLNSLRDTGAGFNFDTNKITIIHRDNTKKHFELKSKREVAVDIVSEIAAGLTRTKRT